MTEHLSNKYLLAFLKTYLAWAADEPVPKSLDFRSSCGLCGNYERFLESPGILACLGLEYDAKVYWSSYDALHYFFKYFNLDTVFPFGEADYYERHDNHTSHTCPARLIFCRDTIAAIEQHIEETSNV